MNVAEHGRLVEVAGAVDGIAAGQRLRAAIDRVLDEFGDLVALVGVDQRPDLDPRFGAAPELHGTDPLGQALGELGCDRLVHVEAVRGSAGLTDVAHLREHRALHGGVQIGIPEHQERRVAAEFHREPQ